MFSRGLTLSFSPFVLWVLRLNRSAGGCLYFFTRRAGKRYPLPRTSPCHRRRSLLLPVVYFLEESPPLKPQTGTLTRARLVLYDIRSQSFDRLRGNWDIIDNQWNVLDVQKRVVTEEFNQRYMNRPYGNVWLLLRPLCYRVHPYRWCTIGADIKHVQNATLMDVQLFFNRFYRPDNAILSIAGNFNPEQTLLWVEKLFASILPSSPSMLLPVPKRKYPSEPEQTSPRRKEVVCNVPNDALYMAWHMCNRWSPHYYTYDMVSDILSNGHSSRLYQRLVQQEHLFTEINAYITGDLDQGLFVVSGKLCSGIDPHLAENAVNQELLSLQQEPVSAHEIQKVANKFENNFLFSQYKASDRALSLCYFEMIESPDLVNSEPDNYRTITPEDIQRVSRSLSPDRCSTLIIRKQSSDN